MNLFRKIMLLLPMLLIVATCQTTIDAQTRRKGKTVARKTTRTTGTTRVKTPYRDIPYEGYNTDSREGKPVDLGLSVMWADRNVGAMTPADYGALFAWGDVSDTYRRKKEEEYPNMTSIIGTEYDAAHVKWGNGWRMPTKTEMIELFEKCKMTFVGIGGGQVAMKLTGPNGNSILLPLGGYINPYNGYLRENRWRQGFYWVGETNVDETIWHMGRLNPVSKSSYRKNGRDLGVSMSFDWQVGLSGIDMKLHYIADQEKNWALSVRPVKDGHMPQSEKTTGETQKVKSSSNLSSTRKHVTNCKTPTNNKRKVSHSSSSSKHVTNCRTPQNANEGEVDLMQIPVVKKIVTDNGDEIELAEEKGIEGLDDSQIQTDTIKSLVKPTDYAVDLGLSVKWADRNIGAKSKTEYGDFFSWADPKQNNNDVSNKYLNKKVPKNISGTEYDIAKYKWGERWRMPTKAECEELVNECVITPEVLDGQQGLKVEGKNGNWIFLPCGGFKAKGFIEAHKFKDEFCQIWASEVVPNDKENAVSFFGDNETLSVYKFKKWVMLNVRAVTKESLKPIVRIRVVKRRKRTK